MVGRIIAPRRSLANRRLVAVTASIALLIMVGAALLVGAKSVFAASVAVQITDSDAAGCTPGANGQGTRYCFLPGNAQVNSGDTVTWINTSRATHTVTRCPAGTTTCPNGPGTGTDPATFDSGNINPTGSSTPVTFRGAGIYNYYCALHGYAAMHATVTVAAAAASPPPTATPASSPSSAAATPAAVPAVVGLPNAGGPPATRPDGIPWVPIALACMITGILVVSTVWKRRRRA